MRPTLWAVTLFTLASPALGQEAACSGKISGMGCFDAAPLSGPAEPSPFRWFGRGVVLDFGQLAASTVVRYASSPVELVAPSSDPEGRLIPIVRRSTRIDLRLAVGLGRGIDLTLVQHTGLAQTGAGPDALITQSPPALGASGLGDTRLSMRTRLPESLQSFDWAMRLELTLPLGDERAYLGERSCTEAAALNAGLSVGRFSFVADSGLRVSRRTRIGDVTLGTHAFFGLGVDFAALEKDRLHVALEALVRPQLISPLAVPLPKNDDTRRYGEPANWVIPAEWLLSVSSRPFEPDLWFSVGAGTAMPLSHREGANSRADAWFIAPSTPRHQIMAAIAVRE